MTEKVQVQMCCPACNKEVSEAELSANKCDACGASLSAPIQNATVTVDPIPLLGSMF
jgi:Zn finger protein HypA/HybF involved in hydrogenase expression